MNIFDRKAMFLWFIFVFIGVATFFCGATVLTNAVATRRKEGLVLFGEGQPPVLVHSCNPRIDFSLVIRCYAASAHVRRVPSAPVFPQQHQQQPLQPIMSTKEFYDINHACWGLLCFNSVHRNRPLGLLYYITIFCFPYKQWRVALVF